MPTGKTRAVSDRCRRCSTIADHTPTSFALGPVKPDHISYNVDPEQLTRLTVQRELATAWAALDPSLPADHIHVVPSIEHAVNVVRALDGVGGERVDVLVTGSLHLVAGVIEVAGLAEVAL
jgi:folylpolyglutamate synthase